MDAYGSDHAPAYADLAPSLPIAVGSAPPPLSSRYLYTGYIHIFRRSFIVLPCGMLRPIDVASAGCSGWLRAGRIPCTGIYFHPE